MAKAKPKKKASGLRPQASGKKATKAAPKKKASAKKPAKVETPEVSPSPAVDSTEAPRAERGLSILECAQCHGSIDPGALRITLDAGGALHPACTFGWTLDHLPDNSATADWMARLMQRSRLSAEDRAELLVELDAPTA